MKLIFNRNRNGNLKFLFRGVATPASFEETIQATKDKIEGSDGLSEYEAKTNEMLEKIASKLKELPDTDPQKIAFLEELKELRDLDTNADTSSDGVFKLLLNKIGLESKDLIVITKTLDRLEAKYIGIDQGELQRRVQDKLVHLDATDKDKKYLSKWTKNLISEDKDPNMPAAKIFMGKLWAHFDQLVDQKVNSTGFLARDIGGGEAKEIMWEMNAQKVLDKEFGSISDISRSVGDLGETDSEKVGEKSPNLQERKADLVVSDESLEESKKTLNTQLDDFEMAVDGVSSNGYVNVATYIIDRAVLDFRKTINQVDDPKEYKEALKDQVGKLREAIKKEVVSPNYKKKYQGLVDGLETNLSIPSLAVDSLAPEEANSRIDKRPTPVENLAPAVEQKETNRLDASKSGLVKFIKAISVNDLVPPKKWNVMQRSGLSAELKKYVVSIQKCTTLSELSGLVYGITDVIKEGRGSMGYFSKKEQEGIKGMAKKLEKLAVSLSLEKSQ